MIRKLALVSGLTLFTAHAFADEIAIRPKLTHSQLKFDAEGASWNGQNMPITKTSDDTVEGNGFGVDFDFRMVDRAKLGASVSVTNYEKNQTEANDTALGGYFGYDFVDQDNFRFYGKAGLSLHQFALKDYDSASLLNTDVGAGLAFAVAPNMDLGGEYQYSTTLSKSDMSSNKVNDYKLTDVSAERNDLSLFFAFRF